MKHLVIAEKPSVARDIARVLGCSKKSNSYIEGNGYVVTWALGHLVTLADPEEYGEQYKTWKNVGRKRWGDFHRTAEPYVIYIYYRGTNKIPDLSPLYEMLYEMIPANLIIKVLYKYQTWGEVNDQYDHWSELHGQSWGIIRLGNRTL